MAKQIRVASKLRQRCSTFKGDAAYTEIALQEFFDDIGENVKEMEVRTFFNENDSQITTILFYAEVLEFSTFLEDGTLLKTETPGGLMIPKVPLELVK